MPKPSLIFNGDGTVTRVWPPGTTLAQAGYRLVASERNNPMPKDPVKLVEGIAAQRHISFEQALDTPQGAEAYREYKQGLIASASAPTVPARASAADSSRFGERFSRDGAAALKAAESDIDAQARARCKERGLVASRENIAKMMSELITEDPGVYSAYVRTQRSAQG